MSLRRTHQKTKLGCSTCKRRRVKCDLSRPDCKNCTRRGVECGFRNFDPAPRSFTSTNGQAVSSASLSLQPYASPPQSPPPPVFLESILDDFPEILRPRFKQLLHHFATETSATISHNGSAQAAWCAAIPQFTASHQFVLKGMFAVTALHLSRNITVEKEREHFHHIAAAQMNTGLIRYRETIGNVTAENAEALFLYSVTATSFTLLASADECHELLQSISSENQAQTQRLAAIAGLVHAITKVLCCLRGVRVILVPCWHLIANGILSPLVKRDWWPHPIPTSPQAVEEDKKLRNIERLWMQPGRRYEYWFDILIQALKKLREDFALVSLLGAGNSNGPNQENSISFDWSSVLTWPIGAPPEFTNLLEQRKPEAWIILAHYAILPAKAGQIWWIKDLAPNIVSTAALVLGEGMWKWINWPASTVGVDLNSLRPPSTALAECGTLETTKGN
ncbi:hypothetical protein K458DRAFT_318100 [Lentithecium fluviatile CBS 122367]|uniref:Zn(2)-C6 fungal-type domain-containing protein n=1 Tax=Lentithecium fluviatile CBS 122367 TaxID=1168545 RepID=A0A6G1IIV3_9PLEO|nr:hypothetical protein K458DRAFT_318100 [Lentithecium fluviatile CBS 122367]